MAVYITAMVLSIALCELFQHYDVKLGNQAIPGIIKSFFIAFPLSFVAGFRYAVGTDYFSYVKEYETVISGGSTRMEPLFYIFLKLLSVLKLNSQWIFIITAFLFCTLIIDVIMNESDNKSLSIFLFLSTGTYFMFLNGTRQLLACAIGLYSFKYLKSKDLKKLIFCLIVASCIHYSTILIVLVYILNFIKLDKKKMVFATIITILSANIIANLFFKFFSNLDYYKYYLTTYNNSSLSTWAYINIAVAIFLFLLYDEEKSSEIKPYWCSHFFLFLLSFLNGKIPLLSRFMWVFALGQIIALPNVIETSYDNKSKKTVYLILILLFSVYIYVSIFVNGTNDCNHYKFCF